MPAKKKTATIKKTVTPLEVVTELKQAVVTAETALEAACEKGLFKATERLAKLKEKANGTKEKLATQKTLLKDAKAQHKTKPGKVTEKRVAKANESVDKLNEQLASMKLELNELKAVQTTMKQDYSFVLQKAKVLKKLEKEWLKPAKKKTRSKTKKVKPSDTAPEAVTPEQTDD